MPRLILKKEIRNKITQKKYMGKTSKFLGVSYSTLARWTRHNDVHLTDVNFLIFLKKLLKKSYREMLVLENQPELNNN